MSQKIQRFTSFITQPLNTHNFEVVIPAADGGNIEESIVVESTTFPTEKFREVSLWFQGEQIRYPGIPENGGSWKVTIPEADSGIIRRKFDALKNRFWNQKTGILNTDYLWESVPVFARDLKNNVVFSVTLKGVWLKGREAVQLSASSPDTSWKWDYEFVYQWIEDKDGKNEKTPSPPSRRPGFKI
jgi:hypothetical protein